MHFPRLFTLLAVVVQATTFGQHFQIVSRRNLIGAASLNDHTLKSWSTLQPRARPTPSEDLQINPDDSVCANDPECVFITLESINGHKLRLPVYPQDDDWFLICKYIQSATKINPDDIHIVWLGKERSKTEKLVAARVQDGATVKYTVTMRAGPIGAGTGSAQRSAKGAALVGTGKAKVARKPTVKPRGGTKRKAKTAIRAGNPKERRPKVAPKIRAGGNLSNKGAAYVGKGRKK